MLKDRENLSKALDRFKAHVISQSKANLTRQRRNVTQTLYKSITAESKVNPNSIELSFDMSEYGQYLDKGVKGKVSSAKAPNSPFRFGTGTGKKGGLTSGIERWVKLRGIQFREKNGQFMTRKETARLITRSVYNKGIRPSLFFTKPFESAFKNLPDDLVTAFGFDAENLYDFTL